MCIFHTWGKWEQFDKPVPKRMLSSNWMLDSATEHWQKKRCDKCGKVKQEYIGITVG